MAKLTPAELFVIKNYDAYYEIYEVEQRLWGKTEEWLGEAIEDVKGKPWYQGRDDFEMWVQDSVSLSLHSSKWQWSKSRYPVQICTELFDPMHLYMKSMLPYIGVWVAGVVNERHTREDLARRLGLGRSGRIVPIPGVDVSYRQEWVLMQPLASKAAINRAILDPDQFRDLIVRRFDEMSYMIPKLDKLFQTKGK
jgi:hypothetical protein